MALLIEQKRRIDDIVGETIDNYIITIDDVENALRPVLAYVEALLDRPGPNTTSNSASSFQASPTPSAPATCSCASAARST